MSQPANNSNQGFSLLEALIATAIMGIGFVGVYTLAATAELSLRNSVTRQKLQMQADQILEVIESDLTNIDQYNMSLKACVAPDGTETYKVRRYEWCQRLTGEVGAAATNDTRSVAITTLADGRKVVSIVLESNNGGIQIVMKRVYYQPA